MKSELEQKLQKATKKLTLHPAQHSDERKDCEYKRNMENMQRRERIQKNGM